MSKHSQYLTQQPQHAPPGSVAGMAYEAVNRIPTPAGPPGAIKSPRCSQTVEGEMFDGDELSTAIKRGVRSFAGCTLKNARLAGLDLAQFQFVRCNMQGADLRSVMGLQANFDGSDLTGANFENSCLSQAKLNECKLVKANLANCNLKFAETTGTDFTDANLVGAQRLKSDPKIEGWSSADGTLKKVKKVVQ